MLRAFWHHFQLFPCAFGRHLGVSFGCVFQRNRLVFIVLSLFTKWRQMEGIRWGRKVRSYGSSRPASPSDSQQPAGPVTTSYGWRIAGASHFKQFSCFCSLRLVTEGQGPSSLRDPETAGQWIDLAHSLAHSVLNHFHIFEAHRFKVGPSKHRLGLALCAACT